MKIIKRKLPEGVRKKFIVKIGKKVKIVNSLYDKKKKKKDKETNNNKSENKKNISN
jgi:hypothetical protein